MAGFTIQFRTEGVGGVLLVKGSARRVESVKVFFFGFGCSGSLLKMIVIVR